MTKHGYTMGAFLAALVMVGLLSGLAHRPMQYAEGGQRHAFVAIAPSEAPALHNDTNQPASPQRENEPLVENEFITISVAYPNPASQQVNFQYRIHQPQQLFRIAISDVLGAEWRWYTLLPEESLLSINVEHLPPGVYFYSLWMKERIVVTRKLIVKH